MGPILIASGLETMTTRCHHPTAETRLTSNRRISADWFVDVSQFKSLQP